MQFQQGGCAPAQGGYMQGGSMQQGGYMQGGGGMAQVGSAAAGAGQAGFAQGGSAQGGAVQGGYAQGGAVQGGYAQGGYAQGGGYSAGGSGEGSSCLSVCGCDTEQGAETLSFVGAGRGAYIAETTFRFVGTGAGEFDTVRAPQRSSFATVCGALLFVVLLGTVALMLYGVGVTSTTSNGVEKLTLPPVPEAPRGSCLVWGDPHVSTFDHASPNFFEQGDAWLVRSQDVHIQARYLATPFTNGLAATNAIAVGGPFLNGHTISIGPLDDGKILVDGAPALTSFPSTQDVAGIATLSYNSMGNVVDDAQVKLDKHIVHMDLPLGVHIQVLRWANHLNVRITMPPAAGGQDGHCGNFNSIASDDSAAQIQARVGQIPAAALLFRHATPSQAAPRHTLAECKRDAHRYSRAIELCKASEAKLDDAATGGCVFDVCFAGPQYAAQDLLYSKSLQ